jgi:hypothetical protein
MNDLNDAIDEIKTVPKRSDAFLVFAILSYIGNSMFIFGTLLILFTDYQSLGIGDADPFEEDPELIFGAIFLLVICFLSILGVFLLHIKNKTVGFTIHLIANIPFFFSIIGLISILFIYIFNNERKRLNSIKTLI